MSLIRNTEYGKITIHDKVFENLIANICQRPSLYDKIWLAPKFNVKASYDESDGMDLAFSVYVKFGYSIKDICSELADSIRDAMLSRTKDKLNRVLINVSGVRSTNLVRRNMNIEITYNEDGSKKVVIAE